MRVDRVSAAALLRRIESGSAPVILDVRSRAEFTHVQRVYFLAPTEVHRAGLRVALADLGVTDASAPDSERSGASRARTLNRASQPPRPARHV